MTSGGDNFSYFPENQLTKVIIIIIIIIKINDKGPKPLTCHNKKYKIAN